MSNAPQFKSLNGITYQRAQIREGYEKVYKQIANNANLKTLRFKGHLYIEVKPQQS